jgi:hypothetical protein
MKRHIIAAAAVAVAALLPPAAQSAVSAEEAAKLKTTLTPMGAERGANKDGTIPAWDGGLTKPAAGYKNGDPRPDPFPADKPVHTIDAKNMAQHADKLSDGVKALMKKHADFRIEVYPTRRTGGAPQYVYDNTFRNATRAKLVDNGQGIEGAFGGIPFPIPKDGYEVILNHRLAWTGVNWQSPIRVWVMTADGKRSMASGGVQTFRRQYYDPELSADKFDGYYALGKFAVTEPGSKAGEAILAHDGLNASHPRGLWQYLVGQRRVRKAPSVGYDTPDSVTSGIGLFDEAFNLFGPIDKHELKLIGKKELYIPYNNNRAALAKVDDLVKPNALNPSLVRWELHRVWEVDSAPKPGVRHLYSRRVMYFDEDVPSAGISDSYDSGGAIYRVNMTYPYPMYEGEGMVTENFATFDLASGAYVAAGITIETGGWYMTPRQPATYFTPDAMAAAGVR